MKRAFVAVALVSALLAAGCGYSDVSFYGDGGPMVRADGPSIRREIAWAGSQALYFHVPAQITFTQGPVSSFVVTGPKNVVERLLIEGDDVRLSRARYRFWRSDRPLQIAVTAPNVQDLGVGASGRLTADMIRQPKLSLKVSSGASAKVGAEVGELTISVGSSGRLDASGRAEHAIYKVSSGGDADLEFVGVADLVAEVGSSGRLTSRGAVGRLDADVSSGGSARFEAAAAMLRGDVDSSGRMEVRGRADAIDLTVSSGGSADLGEVKTATAVVRASSSGRAIVQANESIDAQASSGGHIAVRGNPRIQSLDTSSSGSVSFDARQAELAR